MGPEWAKRLMRGGSRPRVVFEHSCEVHDISRFARQLPIIALAGALPGHVLSCFHCRTGMNGAAESNAGQPNWPLKVTLSNGHSYGADLVVAAIGVEPNVEWVAPEVTRANDGGLLVSR